MWRRLGGDVVSGWEVDVVARSWAYDLRDTGLSLPVRRSIHPRSAPTPPPALTGATWDSGPYLSVLDTDRQWQHLQQC